MCSLCVAAHMQTDAVVCQQSSSPTIGDSRLDLCDKARAKALREIVDQEASMFDIALPAYRNIFYPVDLPEQMGRTLMNDRVCIGSDLSLEQWFGISWYQEGQVEIKRSLSLYLSKSYRCLLKR